MSVRIKNLSQIKKSNRLLLQKAAVEGMPIAELEYLGVSVSTIALLESCKYQCIFLEDLIDLTVEELSDLKGFGLYTIQEILDALNNFHNLNKIRELWNKGSNRVEFYKNNIPNTVWI